MLLQYEIVLIFWFNIGLCFMDVIYSRCIQYVLIIDRPKHLKMKHYITSLVAIFSNLCQPKLYVSG